MKLKRIVHLIPTYNERENIAKVIKLIRRVVKNDRKRKHLILVVDDNSPDQTAKIVKELQETTQDLHLLTGPKRGLGIAMIRGLKHSLQHLQPDVVISTEADLAFDPKHIPYMLEKIEEGYDVVIGSRHVGDGKTEGWNLNRKLNHFIANKIFATYVAGVREVSDHNGAFRAIRVRHVLDQLDLDNLALTGFGFFSYSLFKLTQITSKFHEFPITYRFRTAGESKVSFNPKYFHTYLMDVLEYISLSLRIRLEKLLSPRKPARLDTWQR